MPMRIMECRQQQLREALSGLKLTNTPLVCEVENQFGRAGYPDDPGIYYFIPWVAKNFNVSIETATNFFFGSLIVLGSLIAAISFFFLFKNWFCRLISLFGFTLLAFVAFRISDVYICSFFAVAMIVPPFIVWSEKNSGLNKKLVLTFCLSGLIVGYCNFTRNNSGTGALFFLIFWIILNHQFSLRQKTSSLILLAICTTIPYVHRGILETQRDQFLKQTNPEHEILTVAHPKWHSIYIGLGYLPNRYGIEYEDSIAFKKVISIRPKTKRHSIEYNSILRNECINILKNDFYFVMKSILSKTLSLLLKVFIFVNFGLIFLFYVKPSIRSIFPIITAIGFYMIPGILTIPVYSYALGLISCSTILGIYMICSGIRKYQLASTFEKSMNVS